MKNLIFLVFLTATLLACSDDDHNDNGPILGEWKLMEATFYTIENDAFTESSIDYSNENIIYNFQSNGILEVSGGQNVGYDDGEYDYFFDEDYLGSSNNPKVLLVKIDNSKWTYDLTNNLMTLSQSYVDGPTLIFEKL